MRLTPSSNKIPVLLIKYKLEKCETLGGLSRVGGGGGGGAGGGGGGGRGFMGDVECV